MQDFAPLPPDGAAWALFLDIDGTLLDIAPTPDEVVIPPGLETLLEKLERHLGGALALISGRGLADISRLFPITGNAAGGHGAEWRLGHSTFVWTNEWLDDVAAELDTAAGRLPGVWLERKERGLAIHYRRAPDQKSAVATLAEAVVARSVEPLRLLPGKAVLELVPAGVSKGSAIERFMGVPPFAGRIPVFVGDDLTDEEGFDAVNSMGGVTIHVGDMPTAAHLRFASPAEVRCWLATLDHQLGGMVEN